MKDAFDKMTERLECQYEAKQQKLGEVRQKLKGQAMQLTRATREMETKVRGRERSRDTRCSSVLLHRSVVAPLLACSVRTET